ncbi:MAG: Rieske 2Fe-2S domain-containing protein [Burkholderiales bacterium]|nr:Rieske 2Fe-2S domain-containing protein [Burkholderiales bacterium]
MPLPPHTASELDRIRAQTLAGRLEWQDSTVPAARIPVENYLSDSIRDAEVERLFRRLPLIAGHASELAAGQVLAHDDYGVPLLLTRDADGRFRAFLNVCRHRGMRLVAATAKAEPRASVVCPYHGWAYKLDGALRHRLHAEAFDDCSAADTNLVALPAEERHGLLWVVPTPGAAIDIAAWLGGLDAEMPFFGVDQLIHFRTVRAEYPANWKLIVDAFLEAYHIRVLHKETIYPFFADGLTAGDRFGPHLQSLVARRAGQEWAKSADSTPPGDMAGLCALVTPSQVIFPNTITIFHPDYLSLITLYPVAAGRLGWTHRMLIPADRATPDWAPHWEKTFRLIEEGVFQKEDIACAIGIQRGFASGANSHLTAGRAEQGLGWFHADVAAALAPAPAAATGKLSRA